MSRLMRPALALMLLAAIGWMLLNREHWDPQQVQAFIEGLGWAGPVVFVLLYAVGTVLFFPGSVLTLAGGALFGPLWGTLINLTGATLGAVLSFLVARYLASDWVERRLGGRLKQLKEGVEQEGWRFVAFVRLVPLFPFNLLNYALGVTRIPLWTYAWSSFLFMAPGALVYTWMGYVGREALTGGEGLVQKALLGLALLAVVAFLPRLVARLRQGTMLTVEALKARIDHGENLLLLDVRSPEEFSGEMGHIPGARNIPLDRLAQALDELAEWVERPVALICRTDRRSSRAAQLLARNGFADLHVVRGGMTAWNAAGYPVER
ncbi:MAG: sulfurtransferase [Gammaproteobacteria bacterium]|nr:MAG: sulfurtransferase [Gammaproteobacteria bacterium]